MTLLSELLDIQLNEVVEPVDPTLAMEEQLEILEQRLSAAKRGLGFANKLKNPAQKKKHMALVFTNLNKIRGSLSKVIDQVAQFDRAERGYMQQPEDTYTGM
jgi:inorganic triphosphatase YgiF